MINFINKKYNNFYNKFLEHSSDLNLNYLIPFDCMKMHY